MDLNVINETIALKPENFSQEYLNYFKEEGELIKKKIYGKVLDIGCGYGRIIPYLIDNVSEYVGIDKNNELIEINKKKYNDNLKIKFICVDAKNLSLFFKPKEFDVIICLWNTLHLIGNKTEILKVINSITKDKIILTFSLKNKKNYLTRLNYYKQFGISYTTDLKTQTINSLIWGESIAYKLSDLKKLSKESKIKLIENGKIGYMGVYGIFKCLNK